jgi:catechol 2,3-dioxygenase-like lactoylglutathione lyase family enzyme/DNA-binding CsgD family transcriptional regulator
MSQSPARGRPPHQDTLTPAEWRVVEGVRHGLTNQAIADRIGVTGDAVKYHVANALSKLGFSSRRELKAWSGVRKDSTLATTPAHCLHSATLEAIGQISRTVADIERSKRWYETVLGLELLFAFDKMAFFRCGELRLYLHEGVVGVESLIYFSVPDIRAAHAALTEGGVEFINAPHLLHRHADGGEEWMAFFKDEEGRPLAIMTCVRPVAETAIQTGESL